MAKPTDAVAVMDDDLPLGYRFAPSDQEVINLYLINLATQQPLPSQAVVERNIYESEPWKIFTNNDKWVSLKDKEVSKNKYIYVHTRLNYASVSSKKIMSRRAGKGSWFRKPKANSITDDSGVVIGYKRSLTYTPDGNRETKKILTKKYGRWTMDEYTVEEKRLPKSFRPCNIVICKITCVGDFAKERGSPPSGDNDDLGNNKRMKRAS